jgi:hypothetical protein
LQIWDTYLSADRPTSSEEETRLEAGPQQSSLVIGPYRLIQRVGEGGMGEVWPAEQTAPVRRQVAHASG